MERSVDVARFIDDRGVGRFQILVLILCFIIMIIDGFDAQAVGFVAPIISVAWGVSKASFSPVFAAGLLGMAIGALLFGALADRFGRKSIIVFCFLTFGVLTLGKAFVASIFDLTVLQFRGGAWRRRRDAECDCADLGIFTGQTAIADGDGSSAGYSVGASGAGFLTARLGASYGWQATFVVGGVAALGDGAGVDRAAARIPSASWCCRALGVRQVMRILRKIDTNLPVECRCRAHVERAEARGLAGRPFVPGGAYRDDHISVARGLHGPAGHLLHDELAAGDDSWRRRHHRWKMRRSRRHCSPPPVCSAPRRRPVDGLVRTGRACWRCRFFWPRHASLRSAALRRRISTLKIIVFLAGLLFGRRASRIERAGG